MKLTVRNDGKGRPSSAEADLTFHQSSTARNGLSIIDVEVSGWGASEGEASRELQDSLARLRDQIDKLFDEAERAAEEAARKLEQENAAEGER